MAKKRSRKCSKARTKRMVQGVKVALPCGARTLSARHRNMLDDEFTQQQWNSCAKQTGCRVVFFTAAKPVMRRPGRKLKSSAPVKRGRKMPCVNARGKFVKCRPGPSQPRAKRARRARR